MPYKDPAKRRESIIRNSEKRNARKRRYYLQNRNYILQWHAQLRHGPTAIETWGKLWQAQDGLCYLCGRQLIAAKAVVDHDHTCCPAERSCRICRRGLACPQCNCAVGQASDDPDRLRRMADALEAAQAQVNDRKASADEQLAFVV